MPEFNLEAADVLNRKSFGCEVLSVVEQIKPLLAGRPAVMQSAILAELLGLLLAGHYIPGDPEETASVRRAVLDAHCALVWELTEVSADILGTDK